MGLEPRVVCPCGRVIGEHYTALRKGLSHNHQWYSRAESVRLEAYVMYYCDMQCAGFFGGGFTHSIEDDAHLVFEILREVDVRVRG